MQAQSDIVHLVQGLKNSDLVTLSPWWVRGQLYEIVPLVQRARVLDCIVVINLSDHTNCVPLSENHHAY